MSNDDPLLLIVSSPSGAGKTTLTQRLRQAIPDLAFSVSHTTRPPRKSEQDGREYHFVTHSAFEKLIAEDTFLEWAEVHDNFYGTSRQEIARNAGARGIIFDIDHQGTRQIKAKAPAAVSVFILPPSMQVLEQRLRGRASEDEATVKRRFQVAREEIAHYGMFDYLLVNDDIEVATEKLIAIYRAEECRRTRAARHAERMLLEARAFGGFIKQEVR